MTLSAKEELAIKKVGSAKEELTIKKMVARLNPSTLGAIMADSHPVRVVRQTAWMKIMFRLNKVVRGVVDKHGVTGIMRMGYYDYSRSLWKFLSIYPESVWDRYIKAVFDYYVQAHQLNPDVLKDVTDVTVKAIKEILGEVEVEKVGGKETGSGDSGKALGEAGASGAKDRGA
jgi:hypothetical protein